MIEALTPAQAITAVLGVEEMKTELQHFSHIFRDIIVKHAIKTQRLQPVGDEIFKDVYRDRDYLYEGMLGTSAQDVKAVAPKIAQTIASLTPDQEIVYLIMRLGIHLRDTIARTYGYQIFEETMPPSAISRDEKAGTIKPVIFGPSITEAFKTTSGLGLLADMSLVSLPVTWRLLDREESRPLEKPVQAWRSSLRDESREVMAEAYIMTRGYFTLAAAVAHKPQHRAAEVERYPQTLIPTNGRDLALLVQNSIRAFTERGQIRLPQPGKSYLDYVHRVLQNYILYGTVGLRVSDLIKGDHVFKPLDRDDVKELKESGHTKVTSTPLDRTIIKRLLTLE